MRKILDRVLARIDKATDAVVRAAHAVRTFDYKLLIPSGRWEKYPYSTAGIERTKFGSYEGLGLGIGLGRIDVWVGWPHRQEEPLLAS